MSSDIVERLESLDHITQSDGLDALIKTCCEAAETIRALRKQCEGMAEALAHIASKECTSHPKAIYAARNAYRTFIGEKG